MSWHKLSRKEKVQWLTQQQADIQRAKELLARFEKLTNKWLKRTQAQASNKQA